MDIIERVAKAIAEAGNGGTWNDENWYKEYQRDVHRVRARAAIEAMREPTPDMVSAAMDYGWQPGPLNIGYDEAWRAMVDAALGKVAA